MTALSTFPRRLRPGREASERAAGSEERPQGRSARQQCREESLGLGGAKSPVHPRVQETNKPPRSSSTIRQLFFVCFWGFFVCFFFFFFFNNISKEESKGRCVFLKSFSVVVLEGVVGLFFLFVMSFFSKGKGREKLLLQSPVFACDGHSWGSGCTVQRRLESRCLPASQPAILAGRSQNKPILGKGPLVDFQIVRDKRERWTEGEPDPREGEDVREKGAGERTGRCSCRGGRCRRGTAVRGMGDASRVMEIRGSAASSHAVASVPHWGTSLLRAS